MHAGEAGTTTDLITGVATWPLDRHRRAVCSRAVCISMATAAVNPPAHFTPPQPGVVAECIPHLEPDLAVAK